MNQHQDDFKQLIESANIPATERELKNRWELIAKEQQTTINNDSAFSPFWRVVSALITKPVHWLVQFMTHDVLPNSFIKTASGVYLDILAWGLNLKRKEATKTQGVVVFARSATGNELTIPAGTEIESANINGTIYSLVTLNEATFGSDQTELTVNVEASEPGINFNLSGGYYSILPIAISGVESVSNPDNWLQSPGADEESDDDLRLRCRNQFSAVNQYHTDAAYLSLITSFDGVNIDNVFFEHDAPRGPGTANAYIMFDIGNPDNDFLQSIETHIMDDGNHGHGDDLKVFAMPETFHDVSCDVWLIPNLSSDEQADTLLSIEQMIRAAFRESGSYSVTRTRPFSRFSFSVLASELHNQWDTLASIDFITTDILSGLSVPRINNLSVNLR